MIALLLVAMLAQTGATWDPVAFPTYHSGYWVSCKGEERVLEHRSLGKFQWELHLGPGSDFALFDHWIEDIEDVHGGSDNLLNGAVVADTMAGRRTWFVAKHHLWIEVVRAGKPPPGCDSFRVTIAHQSRMR